MHGPCITVGSSCEPPDIPLIIYLVVEASRTILFDKHSRIGLNFGILFAWAAVNTTLFPLCCWFMRWKTMRQKKKEQEEKDK